MSEEALQKSLSMKDNSYTYTKIRREDFVKRSNKKVHCSQSTYTGQKLNCNSKGKPLKKNKPAYNNHTAQDVFQFHSTIIILYP